ncbi:serine protease [Spirochaetia bacterium]|nr:serine protease [Spirochaetia bacterium]
MMKITQWVYLRSCLVALDMVLLLSGAFATPAYDSAPAPLQSASAQQNRESTGMSAELLKLVNTAVFEVVVEKPQTDASVYERELDWEMVPYAIRTDKYDSIGTAFAISGTELITAFHVINLGAESMVHDRYFIRDSEKQVYEVDQVVAGSNERDFLVFTVKGRTFTDYFEFEEHFETNDSVFSIGNALGEGIVIRNGLILGTVPEDEAGRWNRLKSSADVNPGNSGGPLVTRGGKVVSLVTHKLDNLLYSLPTSVILETGRDELRYRLRAKAGHVILANTSNRVFETTVPLPGQYQAVQKQIVRAIGDDYDRAMEALFAAAPEYLTGPNNRYLLNASVSSSFPQMELVDKNDNNWFLSDLKVNTYTLPDDGRIALASAAGFNIYKITRPRSVPLKQLDTEPRFIMDTILQNIRTERSLTRSDKYRILSFGDPMEVSEYRDALGRSWIAATWLTEFDDSVRILYILPLPDGPAVISTWQTSSRRREYEWDLRKLCDHIQAAYTATFEGWDEFIALNAALRLDEPGVDEPQVRYIPGFLGDFSFDWKSDAQEVSIEAGTVSVGAGKDVFEWNALSELFIAPAWYRTADLRSDGSQGNETPEQVPSEQAPVEFGLHWLYLNRDSRGREYISLYKNIKPDPRRGSIAAENWNDLVQSKYPYNEKPGISAKDNKGSVGAILRAETPTPGVLYSLYLSMEDPQDEENLSKRFSALKAGIRVSK